MNRSLNWNSVVRVACLLLFVAGCGVSGGSDIDSAKTLTLTELEDATEHLESINYVGTRDNHHYCHADGMGFFRVDGSSWNLEISEVAREMDLSAGNVSIPIKITDGQVGLEGMPNLPALE